MRLFRRCVPVLSIALSLSAPCPRGVAAATAVPAPVPTSPAATAHTVEEWLGLAEAAARGEGRAPDWAQAVESYRHAAELGSGRAMVALGQIYADGKLGAPDFWAARRWWEQAAAADEPVAQRQLGLLLREGKSGPPLLTKGFEWLERAAREGDALAQTEVGWMLWHGIGIEADVAEAADWFRLAMENGDPRGEANLGRFYLKGIGLPKNPRLALEHLIAAARRLDDRWMGTDFVGVFMLSAPSERAALRQMIEACMEEPEFMRAEGCLPEACLSVWEGTLSDTADEAKARALFQRLVEARRPQSGLLLAWHAYVGWHMPYDLAVVRARLDEAKTRYPVDAERMRAIIESIAGETRERRQAAGEVLRRMAKDGDLEAAFTLAGRALSGIGQEPSLELARHYHSFVAKRLESLKNPQADFEVWQKQSSEKYTPPPSPTEVKWWIQQAEQQQAGKASYAARPVFFSRPVYPPDLRRSGAQGSAIIEFVVDPAGTPRDLKAVESSHPLFAAAAISAVQRWRFAPGRHKGKTVAMRMQQPISFQLEGDEPPPAAAVHSQP